MASSICENFLVISSSLEARVITNYNDNPKKLLLTIPQFVEDKKKPSETEPSKVIVKISKSNNYLAICSGKRLSVWSTINWWLVSSRDIVRCSSNFIFTPKETHIILADKGGDVYLYSIVNSEPGTLILGHLSIVLDVLISDDEKFIITCDRDEKIRISNYPNSYNIHSYCLGHKEFVSCLKFLPNNENILISASGDGTIKFWNYLQGLELFNYSLDDVLNNLALDNKYTAINNLDVIKISSNSSILLFSVANISKLFLLLVQLNPELSCTYYDNIDVSYDIISYSVSHSNLLILSGKKVGELSYYTWNSDEKIFKKHETKDFLLDEEDINKCCDLSLLKQDSMDYLFKKKYDNVQEYLEKKKARIQASH